MKDSFPGFIHIPLTLVFAILGVERKVSQTQTHISNSNCITKVLLLPQTRTIKFTCPAKQRAEYLTHARLFEDIADDPTDNMYSGKIFPLPGEIQRAPVKDLAHREGPYLQRSLRHRYHNAVISAIYDS
ncbi:AIF_HP2_G0052420.mRNA.1.CDS.1 [Saccharomyces cerevisiae]|nr:AIF_HP2_G0052420.mRNA.1.CDS.1 [Saccharomyces cerevisiae]CAI6798537.1 AIF_HP2_G0052420.mRNA.1.CDS.1 [Saccharomyces cerevisiae]